MRKERLFYDAQAGVLAKTLKEGAPCPVCGSKSHPHPAPFHKEVPSKELLDEEKGKLEAFEKEREELSMNAGRQEEKLKHMEQDIRKEIKKLPGEKKRQWTVPQQQWIGTLYPWKNWSPL